jgi:hypothetical protein
MFSDRSVFGDEKLYSLSVGVLIHPRRSEKAEQEVQSGDGFVGTRQKELQSLFKMKTRTPRGHD